MSPLVSVVLLVLGTLGSSSACLITNCPRGGKRASSARSGIDRPRSRPMAMSSVECVSCDPENGGICVGPGMCCSPRGGCLLAAGGPCAHGRVTAFPPHCMLPVGGGPGGADVPQAQGQELARLVMRCGAGADRDRDGDSPAAFGSGLGRCAANGVCCTHDSCRLDSRCSLDSNELPGPVFDPEFLAAVRAVRAVRASQSQRS